MPSPVEFDAKISPEGRVVIPAEIRKALDVGPGDRIRMFLVEGEVRLTSARAMAATLWANNPGGGTGSSVADVREFRAGDRALSDSRFQSDAPPDPRSEDEIANDLAAALGLDG